MVSFLSSWAEQIVIAIIIASIIEMILPDNKNKKYIKMVIGIYILFNIISPFVSKEDLFSIDEFDVEAFAETNQNTQNTEEVNQASMDERLQELYVEELEKNIQSKVEEQGYEVNNCKVDAILYGDEDKQGINSININISKGEGQTSGQSAEQNSNDTVEEVDKVEINVGLSKYFGNNNQDEQTIGNDEIYSLKKTLSDYYEIDVSKINISVK